MDMFGSWAAGASFGLLIVAFYREWTGASLADAKESVERLEGPSSKE